MKVLDMFTFFNKFEIQSFRKDYRMLKFVRVAANS